MRRGCSCRNGARPWRTGRPVGLNEDEARLLMPQWSPSLADGTTLALALLVIDQGMPQWSPSLADGTTRHRQDPGRRPGQAAMEPVLGGRDDPCELMNLSHCSWAAMEPVLGGRDDEHRGGPGGGEHHGRNGARPWRTGRRGRPRPGPATGIPAAMEPVLGGRDDPARRRPHRDPLPGRNGARPWRTGRRSEWNSGVNPAG